MASEYKLSYTANEINSKLHMVDELSAEKANIGTPAVLPPSFPAGKVVTDCQSINGWSNPIQGGQSGIAEDTNDYICGNKCVKYQTTAQRGNLGLNVTNKFFHIKLKIHSLASDTTVWFYVSDAASMSNYAAWKLAVGNALSPWFPVGEWVDITLPWESAKYYGDTSALDLINVIRFRTVGTADVSVQMVSLVDEPSAPGIVSFCFDDGWATQYDAAKILSLRNIPATLYVITNNVGYNGYLTEDQLVSLKHNYGWDIETHGGHIYTDMTEDEIASEWMATKKWLQDRGLGRGDHMAYPGGQNNTNVTELAEKYFSTARTVSNITVPETIPPAQPYRLRATSAISSASEGVSISAAKAQIDAAAASGHWAILVFHRVTDTVETSMDISPSDLAELADYAVASGAVIKTVADVFNSTIVTSTTNDSQCEVTSAVSYEVEQELSTGCQQIARDNIEAQRDEGTKVLIEKITVGAGTTVIERQFEPNGTGYNFRTVEVRFNVPSAAAAGNISVRMANMNPNATNLFALAIPAIAQQARYCEAWCRQKDGYWQGEYSTPSASIYSGQLNRVRSMNEKPISDYPSINYLYFGNTASGIPENTEIEIWAVRA